MALSVPLRYLVITIRILPLSFRLLIGIHYFMMTSGMTLYFTLRCWGLPKKIISCIIAHNKFVYLGGCVKSINNDMVFYLYVYIH